MAYTPEAAADFAYWDAQLAERGDGVIEPGNPVGLPGIIHVAMHAARDVLGEEASTQAVANTAVDMLYEGGVIVLGLSAEGLARYMMGTISIEDIIDTDSDPVDVTDADPSEVATALLTHPEIEKLLSPLNERERQLVALGTWINVDRERLRRIEARVSSSLLEPGFRRLFGDAETT